MDDAQKRLLEELLFSGEKKLSFAKLLYFGHFHAASAFPFPEPSDEEKKRADMRVQELEAFCDKNLDGAKIDKEADIPESVLQGLAKMGILGLTAPKEYGGQGETQYVYSRCIEALAARCSSTALYVNAHQSIGLRALVLFGTQAQKDTWLPKLCSGAYKGAFALTEPDAGSDAAGVKTRAVYDPVKKVYRINGQKQWITNGSVANVLTLMAQTEVDTPRGKEDKITAFLVSSDMPGFSVKAHALEKVGMRGTKTALLEFKDMEVPEANILGKKGQGLKVALTVLDFGRTTFGSTCTGAAKYIFERALKHAQTREQFKRKLSTFPMVKKKLALMGAYTYAMDAMSFLTAGLVDRGLEEFLLEAAILKVFVSDNVWNVLYDGMQIFGGRSFFCDEPFERMMRDARLNTIGEGANEVLQAFIALVGIRDVGMMFKEGSQALWTPFSQPERVKAMFAQFLCYAKRPHIPVRSQYLQKEGVALSKAVRSFAFAIFCMLVKHGEDLVERQLVLDRLATCVTYLYASTAVLSKLDNALMRAHDNPSALGNDVDLGLLFLHHAEKKIRCALKHLRCNDDKELESVSDGLRPGIFKAGIAK